VTTFNDSTATAGRHLLLPRGVESSAEWRHPRCRRPVGTSAACTTPGVHRTRRHHGRRTTRLLAWTAGFPPAPSTSLSPSTASARRGRAVASASTPRGGGGGGRTTTAATPPAGSDILYKSRRRCLRNASRRSRHVPARVTRGPGTGPRWQEQMVGPEDPTSRRSDEMGLKAGGHRSGSRPGRLGLRGRQDGATRGGSAVGRGR